MKLLKRLLIVVILIITTFSVYVIIVNRNSKNMTYRQKIMKAIYPAFMWVTKLTGTNSTILTGNTIPPVSFYSLQGTLNNGQPFDFSSLRGKKVLLVNTASDCGYTNQYETLQELATRYKDQLEVIGFPANDFKEQEKSDDEQILQFCKINFGVSFPLAKKSVVVNSPEQNPIFKWLTDKTQNGWNNRFPDWNFSKYLVNEEGVLINYFAPSISPLREEVIAAIEKK